MGVTGGGFSRAIFFRRKERLQFLRFVLPAFGERTVRAHECLLQAAPAYPLRKHLLLGMAGLTAVLLKLAQQADSRDVVAVFRLRTALADCILVGNGEIIGAIMRRRCR